MSDRLGCIVLVSRGLDPIGTGRQVLLAARGLLDRGWEVHLAVVSEDGGMATAARQAGAIVHPLSTRPASPFTGLDPALIAALAGLVRRVRTDLVECWGWTAATAAALAMVGDRRPRLVIRSSTPPGRSRMRRWAIARSDVVLADSDAAAAACVAAAPGRAVMVIPPGIPIDTGPVATREEVAARYGLRPDRPWTLCVAPLEATSRIERLLWAMDQLDVVHRDVEHLLVGAGGRAAGIARRARVQWVTHRLRIVPRMPGPLHHAAEDLVRHAALVWQSGEVALGGAILDAMAAGRPIVAVESMAARNLIEDGVSGRIVPADPVSEFPRQAMRLLEEAAIATRVGDAARLRAAERFSLTAFQEAHAAAIERVCR